MFLWRGFKIPTPKTLEKLENIQKNVFSVVLIPDWKLLCRPFTGSAQKRKDIPRFRNFPEAFTNMCLFSLTLQACKAKLPTSTKADPNKSVSCEFCQETV